MCNCSCDSENLYNSLKSQVSSELTDDVGPGEIDETLNSVWSQLLGFNHRRAFESLMDRMRRSLPRVEQKIEEYAWLRGVAETLIVSLETERVELEGYGEVYGPRGELQDDQKGFSDVIFRFRDDDELVSHVNIYGGYEICDRCKTSIESFLHSVNEVYAGGSTGYSDREIDNKKITRPKCDKTNILPNKVDFIEDGIGDITELVNEQTNTLDAIYDEVIESIRSDLYSLGGDSKATQIVYDSIIKYLFGLSEIDDEYAYYDPWAFNVVYEKRANSESDGYGYILSDSQILHIRSRVEELVREDGEEASRSTGLADFYESFYESIDNPNDEITARTIEAAWKLQRYDGFIREGKGLMRVVNETKLPVYAEKTDYEALVGTTPVTKIEDSVIHNSRIIEVPIFRANSLGRQLSADTKPGDSFEFMGVAWLMTNHPIPPYIRMSFLDIIRSIEGTLTRWIERFTASSERRRSAKIRKKREKDSFLRNHSESFETEELINALNGISKLEKDKYKDAKKSIYRLINLRQVPRKSSLEKDIESLAEAVFGIKCDTYPNVEVSVGEGVNIEGLTEDLRTYLKQSIVSLALNSVDHSSSHIEFFEVKIQQTEDQITMLVADGGDGVSNRQAELINAMADEMIRGWDNGIHISHDYLRWSTRVQSIFKNEVSTNITKHSGWYGIISEWDVERFEVNSGGTSGKGMNINITFNTRIDR